MRLYNGCPDSQLKALWDEDDRLCAELKKKHPQAYCTRFYPPDEGFQVHVWGKPLTPILLTRFAALRTALGIDP